MRTPACEPSSDDVHGARTNGGAMTRRHDEELLDAALADSFPASDPPAMTVPAPSAPEPDMAQTRAALPPHEVTLLYRVVPAADGPNAFSAQPPYHAGRWT